MKRHRVVEIVSRHLRGKHLGEFLFVVDEEGTQTTPDGWCIPLRPDYPIPSNDVLWSFFRALEEEIDLEDHLSIIFTLGLPISPYTEDELVVQAFIQKAEKYARTGSLDMEAFPEPHFYRYCFYAGTGVDITVALSMPEPIVFVRGLVYWENRRPVRGHDRQTRLTEAQVASFLKRVERMQLWKAPTRLPEGSRMIMGTAAPYVWTFEAIYRDKHHRIFWYEDDDWTDENMRWFSEMESSFLDIASVFELGSERNSYFWPGGIVVPWWPVQFGPWEPIGTETPDGAHGAE